MINLRLLKLSDLKVYPSQEKPSYVFIRANGETTSDSQKPQRTYSNQTSRVFANLIREFTNNDGTN